MAPTGGEPGYAGDEVYSLLRDHARQTRAGLAVSDSKGFRVSLPHRQSFSPDAAYYIVKRADYFAAGTLVVWDVELLDPAAVVRVYRATDPGVPTRYRRGEAAEVEPAVPGWTMPVDDLFIQINTNEGR